MERNDIEGNFVLDGSVVIKWFCQEEGTAQSLDYRASYIKGKANIAGPDLILYEIANALRHNKSLAQKDVENAVHSIMDI